MLKLDFSKTIYNQLASAALDEIKDHPHTEDEIRWYLSGIAFVAANFFSVRQQIRQEERETIKELINEFFDIYESDGVEFWVEIDSEDGAENIYKRFQSWKERAEAIRKRGEK